MADVEKLNVEELEGVAGGAAGTTNGAIRTVANLTGGYLAIRTAPEAKNENEINHTGLHNGDQVQIVGPYVQGTGFGGGPATYVKVFAPKYGITGYVNAYYLK